MRVLEGRSGVHDAVGTELGVSDWRGVTRADLAVVPGEGLLVLSLGPGLLFSTVAFEGFHTVLNYGCERVRFHGSVPAGSRVRLRAELLAATPSAAGVRVDIRQTFEREGVAEPVCVAHGVLVLLDDGGSDGDA